MNEIDLKKIKANSKSSAMIGKNFYRYFGRTHGNRMS